MINLVRKNSHKKLQKEQKEGNPATSGPNWIVEIEQSEFTSLNRGTGIKQRKRKTSLMM